MKIEVFWVSKKSRKKVVSYRKKLHKARIFNFIFFLFFEKKTDTAVILVGDGYYGHQTSSSYEDLVNYFLKNSSLNIPEYPSGYGVCFWEPKPMIDWGYYFYDKYSSCNYEYERHSASLRPVILGVLGLPANLC